MRKKRINKTAVALWATTFVMGIMAGASTASLFAKADEPTPASDEPHPVSIMEKAQEPETYVPDPLEVELIGRTIWGEAEGVESPAERAAVAWCILNRVDSTGGSVEEIVTAPMQFLGYRATGDCPQEHYDLATDVLTRWHLEKQDGVLEVGRTLPADYLFFTGDGRRNYFTTEWKSTDYWDWSLPDPYTF